MRPAPTFDLPSRARRMLSVGTLLSFVVALVVVYVAWGAVFGQNGTGSNVVLGLLLAIAVVYLIATNLAPIVDEWLPIQGTRDGRAALRYALSLLLDVEHVLKDEVRAKKRRIDDIELERIEVAARACREHMTVVEQKGHDPGSVADLKSAIAALESVVHQAFGREKISLFAQLRSLMFAFAIALALRAFVVEPFQIPSASMIPTLQIGDHLFVSRFRYGLSVPFAKDPHYFVRWSVPKPGDVVVFVAPSWVGMNSGEDWIKRVIAGPGQRVKMIDDELVVDDIPYSRVHAGDNVTFQDYEEMSGRWDERSATHHREAIPRGAGDPVVHSVFHSNALKESFPLGAWQRLSGLTCTDTECVVDEGHVFVMGDNRDNSNDGRKWGAVPVDHVKGKAEFIWMSVDGSRRSLSVGKFTLPGFRLERLFMPIE
jgi:signal peptidase I